MMDPRGSVQLEAPRRGHQPAPPPSEPREEATSRALEEALKSSFGIVKLLMLGVVIYFICSGVFIVGPEQQAVILRFGKPVGGNENALRGPGLHWAFPYPIDEVVRIPLGRLQTVGSTIGWYATTATQEAAGTEPPAGPSLNPAVDGYLLTSDGNIIHARGALRYRINQPGLRYFLEFADATNLVEQAFNSALVHAAARYTVDDILTRDTAAFREAVSERLQEVARNQQLGITVDQVDIKVIPPRQATTNFAAVLQAELRSSKVLDEARSYANQTVSRAQAEANARMNAAKNDKARLVEFVAAEAKRFTDLLPAYRSNPTLFVQQQRTDALKRFVTNAQDKIVLPAGGKGRSLRVQLNREPQKPKPAQESTVTDHH